MNSKTFEDVVVWRKAHAWVLSVYKLTECFPKHELFGLTSQLRRAAVSVAANFAEGFKRRGLADKVRMYNIAQGSLEECRYYLILARDLEYAETEAVRRALEEISKMLEGYIHAIKMRQQI
ncbi:MAG TPA: four helix bundle protein [Pyrinomonadaceae bacterium]|nr:four helix bundle protein [Pyrinomonadaceae bacterium]